MAVPYELSWYTDESVLQLDLQGDISVDEMKLIDQRIDQILDKSKLKILLIVQVSALESHYFTVNDLRNTQRYMFHRNLDRIIIIGNNKLSRLISLLVFGLARAGVVQFDSMQKVRAYLADRGFAESQLM